MEMARSKMRRTFVYDPASRTLVERPIESQELGTLIMPDIEDFVSTVDGRVIHGRKGLRDHNKEHNVTNPADYTNQWAEAQKKREARMTGTDNDPRRTEAIVRAFHKLEGRNW